MDLQHFIDEWAKTGGSERANKDTFLNELCDVLGVPRPDKNSGDPERDLYVFERDVPTAHEGGKVTTRKIDLYKHDCFILEAKQGSNPGDKKQGFARRGTEKWNIGMRDAYGQALGYAGAMDDPPPFIVICDIGYCFDVYATFQRGIHRPYPNALNHRIWLSDLPKGPQHVDTLRRIWTEPHALDPSRHAAKVTRRVAERIAKLARSLEDQGHASELVAKFLMRCLFTMFAEDVGLLPARTFTNLIKEHWLPNPPSFTGLGGVSALWQAMNDGATAPLIGKLLRFNGGLFADTSAIPLKRPDLELLLDAAEHDWAEVEPAIFGTLLERALNPKERHMLGAHFTPRAYVERLVRPTIEEPLREEWENVQAAARKLRLDEKAAEARKLVHEFLRKLCATRVLDPACGSGNFLYVALDLFKRIEGEVLAMLRELGEAQERLHIEGERVTPRQFLGIEVKPWAKEIADLVLWIGYLQWHYKSHGKAMPPPEPVLHEYGNIECRDAVLAWDSVELVRDESGKPVTRWDGESYKKSPVTGEMVPDETARVARERYVTPRKAAWPPADIVIGNPPFVGNKRMRAVLGDGYVDALRSAYSDVPDSVDYVMYWWHEAALHCAQKAIQRFGLITTNSITQTYNSNLVAKHLTTANGISIAFAVPNHPWVDTKDGAAVRIAMTVGTRHRRGGVLSLVEHERPGDDDYIAVSMAERQGIISPDLSVGPDVLSAVPLRANFRLSYMGVTLEGDGFVLERTDLSRYGLDPSQLPSYVRPYRIGRDFTRKAQERYVIDFFGMSEDDCRREAPDLYQRVIDLVRGKREAKASNNKDYAAYAKRWWLFAKPRPGLRLAAHGLNWLIATCRTATQRTFVYVPADVLVESTVVAMALESYVFFGILSSRIHCVWALRAGSRLGVGDDPRYNNTKCFAKFPFPDIEDPVAECVTQLATRLHEHRLACLAKHPELILTDVYNVLEKLRKGVPLSDKERVIHDQGLVSVLKTIHDDLDAAVCAAYGWPSTLADDEILQKLVDLNAERAEEERKGYIRWLRPEFQNPNGDTATQGALIDTEDDDDAEAAAAPEAKPWPKRLPEKIAAVRDRLTAWGRAASVEEIASAFKRAPRKDVEEILDSLAAVGVLTELDAEGGKRWKAILRAA